MGITFSPLFFFTWFRFTHLDLMFKFRWKHNPFGTIRSISRSDPYYNMLFEDYSDSCDAMYYIKEKLKKNVIYLLLFLA